MKAMLIVPCNYKQTGGFYLPLKHYEKYLSENGYTVLFFELPYHLYGRNDMKKYQENLRKEIDKGYDVLISFGLNQCAIFTRLVDIRSLDCKCIGIMMDCMRLHAESVLPYKKGCREKGTMILKKAVYTYREKKCLKIFKSTIFVSSVDTEYVKNFYKKRKGEVYYVPNGIDIPEKINQSSSHSGILYLGCLTGFSKDTVNENLYPLIHSVFPYISKVLPNVRLVIAGRGCPQDLEREINSIKNIKYIGEVDNLDDFYSGVDIILSTVRKKCGIINRILEGWSYSKAVVGYKSNFSTFSEAVDGRDYISADSKEEFLSVISKCKDGTYDLNQIGRNGREIVRQYYTWDISGKKLLDVIENG